MSDTHPTTERAISAVLLASHGQRHWLKEPHPPFTATDALAVAHYGGPSAGLDLWRMCRAVEMLRVASVADPVGWRPIETARKDTHAILVWCPERRNQYAATWYAPYGGWTVFGAGGTRILEEITHWRPLPDDPIPAPQSTAQTVEAVPGALVGDEAPTGAVVATGEVL